MSARRNGGESVHENCFCLRIKTKRNFSISKILPLLEVSLYFVKYTPLLSVSNCNERTV